MKYLKEYGTDNNKKYILVYERNDIDDLTKLLNKNYHVLKFGYGDYEFINSDKQIIKLPDMMFVSLHIDIPAVANFKKIKIPLVLELLFATHYNYIDQRQDLDSLDSMFIIKDLQGNGVCDMDFSNSLYWLTPYQMSILPNYLSIKDDEHPRELLFNLKDKLFTNRTLIKFDNKWEQYWAEKIRFKPSIYHAMKQCNIITKELTEIYNSLWGNGLLGKIGEN